MKIDFQSRNEITNKTQATLFDPSTDRGRFQDKKIIEEQKEEYEKDEPVDKDKKKPEVQETNYLFTAKRVGGEGEIPKRPVIIAEEDLYSDNKQLCITIVKYTSIILGILVICFLFPILLYYSFQSVKALKYGILVNGNTYKVYEDKLYTGGRYYNGINYYFLQFPRSNLFIQRITLTNKTISNDNILYDKPIIIRTM